MVKQANGEIIVGFDGQATSPSVVAYAVLVTSLHKICDAAEFRRQGLGNSLVKSLIDYASHRSCRSIDLWVDEANNDAARGLYTKHGFVVKELVQDYYSPGRTGVKMILNFENDM